MNFKKTFYKIDIETVPTGKINEITGKPIMEKVEKLTPYKCEFQPLDEKMYQSALGRFPDITDLLICRPLKFLQTGAEIVYKDIKYEVLYRPRDWGKHIEVFVKPKK
ncbi:MAG: phage head completion protein [Bacillota bacterium]